MKSIVSYPERGEGGKNSYRGNCSPKLIEDIISQYKIKQLSDFMVGGGTTEEVCKRLDVPGTYLDLNRGFDMVNILEDAGKALSLQEIYNKIDGHKKCKLNPHWKEKIRQTLQSYNKFRNAEKGVWAIA